MKTVAITSIEGRTRRTKWHAVEWDETKATMTLCSRRAIPLITVSITLFLLTVMPGAEAAAVTRWAAPPYSCLWISSPNEFVRSEVKHLQAGASRWASKQIGRHHHPYRSLHQEQAGNRAGTFWTAVEAPLPRPVSRHLASPCRSPAAGSSTPPPSSPIPSLRFIWPKCISIVEFGYNFFPIKLVSFVHLSSSCPVVESFTPASKNTERLRCVMWIDLLSLSYELGAGPRCLLESP